MKGNFLKPPSTLKYDLMIEPLLIAQVNLDVLPTVSIKNYNIEADLSGFTLRIILNVQNPYPFDIVLREVNFNAKVGGKDFGKISTTSQTRIPSSGNANITLKTRISSSKGLNIFSHMFEVIRTLFSKKRRSLSLEGEMIFDVSAPDIQSQTIRIPINLLANL